VLKLTGSIYLHCDPTASHYIKLLMDAVFGADHFRNEIIWKRTTAHSSAQKYAPIHDVLFYFVKSPGRIWNSPRIGYTDEYLQKYYRFDDGDGRLYWRADLCAAGIRHGRSGVPWRGIDPTAKGMHWKFTVERLEELDAEGRIYWPKGGTMPQYKRYREELKGKAVADLWDDIDRINPVGSERLGFPTQKPEALLERIIKASSNEGEVVLDPFCGCGTAIAVAEKLKRRWIGIDITYLAINLVQRRLRDSFAEQLSPYEIVGAPTDVQGAEALKEINPYQFEWWAVDLVNARPAKDHKKGADRGIDGYINFFDDKSGQAKQVIVQVKSGHIGVNHVRDLKGVLEREKAAIGALITLREPTQPMLTEAAATGFYESKDFPGRYPRLQILTIAELLAGKKLEYPTHRVETFAKAERKTKHEQEGLF
jgi:site-specific DNA-methyltransferase (adenine-specific)